VQLPKVTYDQLYLLFYEFVEGVGVQETVFSSC